MIRARRTVMVKTSKKQLYNLGKNATKKVDQYEDNLEWGLERARRKKFRLHKNLTGER